MTHRNAGLDGLRVLIVTLVVAHHAGQAYVPTGPEWLIGPWPVRNPDLLRWLGPFMAVNAGFFMGLFFWVAGYLTPGSLQRKGPWPFLRGRLLRLGVPMLVFFLLFSVPVSYFSSRGGVTGRELSLPLYYLSPWRWDWQAVYMHLWFLGHLLVYSAVYAAWRAWRGPTPEDTAPAPRAPGHGVLLGCVALLAGVSALVQVFIPHDVWLFVGIPIEPAHLPQYVLMFALGIAAARTDAWRRLPARTGFIWLGIGMLAAAAAWLPLLPGASLPHVMFPGGPDGRTALSALWEALVCVGLSAGLLTLFRERVRALPALARELAACSYTVYILHLLVVTALQVAFLSAPLGPNARFFAVFALAWPASFMLAALIRRLPGARRML